MAKEMIYLGDFLKIFIYLAVPSLHCCMQDLFSCGMWALSRAMQGLVP